MKTALVWFRRDLRDFDHAALFHALKENDQVYTVFVFDTDILDQLSDKADRRVEFIWESVRELKQALNRRGSDLIVLHGRAIEELPRLAQQLRVQAVYSNRDYEPVAIRRDQLVSTRLKEAGISFHQFKDQAIFHEDEIMTQAGKSYTVFTPYKKAVLSKLSDFYLKSYPVDAYIAHLAKVPTTLMPSLESLGFKRTDLKQLKLPTGMSGGRFLFDDFMTRMPYYRDRRDFPAIKGSSYLSVHLRFGTVSIRQLANKAWYSKEEGASTWLNELIWRDFYFQILYFRPDLAEGRAYRREYEHLNYPNNQVLFEAWCQGQTGYPIVDAAMRQLNNTGYMHNRLRMVTASFLVKDLLVDWRWGERYFAEKLIDFDFSANNGGWQWAASTGCDAQPYFRIFNPIAQSRRFDKNGQFIRQYVPELSECNDELIHQPWSFSSLQQQMALDITGQNYPAPIVDHGLQREKALGLYKKY
ncbi:MAG: deoxyribodipyrimidine photo-lyase [Methylophilus sp.]|nr:deoxyribodipyrimidine photo-lyase [Methylophilus sp.]